jgi:hypothetical protein
VVLQRNYYNLYCSLPCGTRVFVNLKLWLFPMVNMNHPVLHGQHSSCFASANDMRRGVVRVQTQSRTFSYKYVFFNNSVSFSIAQHQSSSTTTFQQVTLENSTFVHSTNNRITFGKSDLHMSELTTDNAFRYDFVDCSAHGARS